MIDSATRYSAAALITTKHQDEMIRNICLIWIGYFGYPQKFMSDNGGEFSNEKFCEMSEKLNIETITTAAESPFSNGIVERHNLMLAEAMYKTIDDVHCEPKIALAWATCAKNSLQSYNGFSPNQLVFGHNINIPSVLTDDLPALESWTTSDIIRENMKAMHVARQKYVEAESSEKIRRALRHKVRSYADVKYSNGDRVYYRRKDYKGWKGPAVVLGQDGQFVLLRHGGAYSRVHPCQLMKVVGNENVNKETNTSKSETETVEDKSLDKRVKVISEDDSDDESQHTKIDDSNESEHLIDVGEHVSDAGEQVSDVREQVAQNSVTKPKKNTFVRYKLEV